MALPAAVVTAALLGGCSSSQSVVSSGFTSVGSGSSARAPMFPEEKWGVSASRRVAGAGERIPKGGGRYKVGDPYKVGGRWYQPREQPDYDRVGVASWYGEGFHGRHTANGEIFDMHALTAAHPTLPMPSYAYVTNLSNDRTILVRINDRGPYVGERMIDLSKASAKTLGLMSGGTGKVRVRYAGPAPLDGSDHHERQFLASRSWNGGNDIAAHERAQSARELAAYDGNAMPRSATPAWEPARPVAALQPARPLYADNRLDRRYPPDNDLPGYGQPYGPSEGYVAAPQQVAPQYQARSYADASMGTGEVWSPQAYRQAQGKR